MDSIEIEVLFEGATEEKVLGQLSREIRHSDEIIREKICHQPLKLTSAGGQGKIPAELRRILQNLSLFPETTARLLIVWDRDDKDNSVRCDSVLGVVREFARNARWENSPDFDNVYLLCNGPDNLRLALHIAADCCYPSFQKATTDDYVLKLALKESTAARLLDDRKRNRPDWKITTPQLIEKITKEIPDLLKQNGIPLLPDAKEYVRFYAAVLALHTSPPVFAEKTLAHAKEDDIKEIFAPLLAAIQHLERA